MSLLHLSSKATVEDVTSCIQEHGYAIVDELIPAALLDRVLRDLDPYLESSRFGTNDGVGKLTKRTGALIARSPAVREIVMNPLLIGVASQMLSRARQFHLSACGAISLWPGSKAQVIHRDEVGWGEFPFPSDYEIMSNNLVALSDYTEEMGATRVVPGSHRLEQPDIKFEIEQSFGAAMKRGSVLMYGGKLYHGSGENKSQRIRRAMSCSYVAGWLRQEENQYLACPTEIARALPDELLRLMGYNTLDTGLGRVGDWMDPLSLLKEGQGASEAALGIDTEQLYSRATQQ